MSAPTPRQFVIRRGAAKRFTEEQQQALALAAEASGSNVAYLHALAPDKTPRQLRGLANDPSFQARVEAIREHRLHRAAMFDSWALLRMDDCQRIIEDDGLHSNDPELRLKTAWEIVERVRPRLAHEGTGNVNVLVRADAQLQQTLVQVLGNVINLKGIADASGYDPNTDPHLLRGEAALPTPIAAAVAPLALSPPRVAVPTPDASASVEVEGEVAE